MYESPINLFYTDPFIQAIKDEQENYIMQAVQRMDVQVDKQELVKALAYDRGQYEKGFSDGIKESRWISVEERLPNCNGCYLVWRPHFFGGEIGMPSICYFDGQNTWHDSYGVDFERVLHKEDVTHWMPLPDPPKAAEEDE